MNNVDKLVQAVEWLLTDLNSEIDYEAREVILYHLEQVKEKAE
jgi:hypothetical protein